MRHCPKILVFALAALAVSIPAEATAQSTEYYVLDGFGGVHAGGGAPVIGPSTPYFGFDVAADIVYVSTPGGDGYLVLDDFGGVHVGGAVASAAPATPYFGFNVARAITHRNNKVAFLDRNNVFTGDTNSFEGNVEIADDATTGSTPAVSAVSMTPDGPVALLRGLGGGNLVQGNDSTDTLVFVVTNDGTIIEGSAMALKTDIEPIDGALAKVLQLNGVRFRWRSSGRQDVGFIAEEVGAVVPEIVRFEPDGSAMGIEYGRTTALLVEAIKEQQAILRQLQARVDELSQGR